jgi:hypothetical protein
MLMAFHQIFISNSVQLLGLVLIGLEEKDQQKQKTKQNKTKQNKTKQKPRKKQQQSNSIILFSKYVKINILH